jgi:DHA1 family bicyclomycin/chloramphenicol resistance-like MFS transporter
MDDRPSPTDQQLWTGPGMREFIAMMAALMASNAVAVDAMLPALPDIGSSVGIVEDNQRQLVITFYLVGLGAAQLFYGPLSDRFGRKPVLTASLLLYAVFSLLAGLAGSFTLLLAARVLQGAAAAGTRVIAISVIRDRFHGSRMAQTMSFISIVFMLVPVLAPSLGQAVLVVAGWRTIFIMLALYGLLVLGWTLSRLPESLPRDRRRPLSFGKVREAVAITLTNPLSIGNTVAVTLVMGGLFAFINSIQQIIFDVFGRPDLIGAVFASIAGPMALSSYCNGRFVQRVGARRMSFYGLCGFIVVASLHLTIAYFLGEDLVTFIILQAAMMGTCGLIMGNLGSIAMLPMGHIAGTAASVQGLITTVGGALIGLIVGQLFDGTTLPLLTGFVLCGILGFAAAQWANRNRGSTESEQLSSVN